MEDSLQFGQPVWLWIGFAACAVLAAATVRWNQRRQRDLEKLAQARLLAQLTESFSKRRRSIRQVLWLVALMLGFVALARPQYGFEYREVKRRGIDLVFAVDTSRSMLAEDVVPNRLERSKLAILDFVDRLEGDRVGLIPFAGNAFSLCPLTLDYSAFRQSLEALDTDIIPHQGTDLASAVREANRLFDEQGNNFRILILITDGEDLQGSVMDAVNTAKEKGMTIYTVGVGDPGGTLIPLTMDDGSQDFVRDNSGQPVKTALDEETLKTIAQATGGLYAPLGKTGEGLNTIYREKLRLVPKSEMDQRLDRVPLERFEWPLGAAILLLTIEFLFSERKRDSRARIVPVVSAARRRTRQPAPVKARGVAAMLGLTLLLGAAPLTQAQDSPGNPEPPKPEETLPEDARETYNLGTQSYRDGDFEHAEAMLGHGLAQTTDLTLQQRAYYNLGNTRFRLGQQMLQEKPETTISKWEESVKAYEDALALNPDDQDAAFNRDFVKKKLEELKQQQQQQQQDQQNQSQKDQDQDQQQQDQQENQSGQKDSRDSSDNQQDESSKQESQDGQSQENQEQQSPEDKKQQGESGEEKNDSQGQEEPSSENNEQKDKQGSSEQKPQSQDADQKNQEEKGAGGEKEDEDKEASETKPQSGDQGNEEKEDQQQETNSSKPKPGQENQDAEKAEPQPAGETNPQDGNAEFSEERRAPGEMSREEAAQLLQALHSDERSVIPLPDAQTYRQAVPNNTTRGKTW